jgi:poly(3-hydroxybutyrate) depolymerase
MNRLVVALACLVALAFPLASAAQQTAVPLGTTTAPYGFYQYLPFGYDSGSPDEWPVIIFLHGLGETGDGTSQLSDVLVHGIPKNINNGTQYPFVAISPQSPGQWSVSNLDALVQYIKNTYQVDDDRIFLTGLSMGGLGTWNYARTNPEELAAILPMCASQTTIDGSKLVNVPTWVFHSWGDTYNNATSSAYSVQWVNSIAGARMGTGPTDVMANYPGTYSGPPGPDQTSDKDRTASFNATTGAWTWQDGVVRATGSHPTLTLYSNTSHDCWTRTYNNATPLNWLLSNTRFGAANKAPTVSITAPSNNATINDPTSITITATVADSDGTLASVEFFAGNQLLGTDNSSPHQFVWSNPPAGTHWITVKATDNDGDVTAALVKITVAFPGGGATVFQQSFGSSTSVSTYVNATAPSSGQLNDISAKLDGGAWSIQGGRLQLVREGSTTTENDAGLTRHTDFSGAPTLLHVVFDLGISGWTTSTSQTGAMVFSVGRYGGIVDYNSGGVSADAFHSLSVKGEGSGKYSLSVSSIKSPFLNTDGTLHKVALFLNQSAAAETYRAPDGTLRSLRANGVAFWIDTSPVEIDAPAANGSSSALTDFRMRWPTADNATWTLDNFVIRDSFPQ